MQEDRAAFIEGFALKLNESGMQRMAARVFAVLADQRLPHVLSGATTYLTRTKMAERVRTPGERVDRYDVRGTTWAEAIAVETEMLHTLSGWLDKGASLVAGDREATQRLADTRDFFDFIAVEMPKLVDRWQASRRPS